MEDVDEFPRRVTGESARPCIEVLEYGRRKQLTKIPLIDVIAAICTWGPFCLGSRPDYNSVWAWRRLELLAAYRMQWNANIALPLALALECKAVQCAG